MTEIKVLTIPQSRENKDISYKYKKVVEDRNKIIAKRFEMKPLDVTLKFYFSKGEIVSSLGPNYDGMGVYAGYVDGTDEIMVLHPDAAQGLLDNIDKEILVLIDYALVKLYLCKRYYPNREDFKLYYKYVSESLATFSAGNYRENSIKFDIKMHFDGKKYRKEQELNMVFYVMFKNSGLSFIYENLDKIMLDMDIKKSAFNIYKKSINDLLKPEKEKVIEEQKVKMELERAKRAAAREKAVNSSS